MESIQRERSDIVGNQLGLSVFCKQAYALHPAFSNPCANSSVCKISDETLPPLDETIDPSLISNGPGTTLDISHHVEIKALSTKQGGVVFGSSGQAVPACSSRLCTPVQNPVHAVNFSFSNTSQQNDNTDVANLTETIPLGSVHDVSLSFIKSESCIEKCTVKVESKNSTFDMSKSLEKVTLSSPALACVKTDSNITFESEEHKENIDPALLLNSTVSKEQDCEKVMQERHLNSTVEICGRANTTLEQKPNEKLDCTVDISQSNVQNQEMCNERLASSKNCEKNATFTKSAEESSAGVDVTADLGQNVCQSHVPTDAFEPNASSVQLTFSKHNLTTDLTPPESRTALRNSTMNMTQTSSAELPTQSTADAGVVNDIPLFKPPDTAGTKIAVTVSSEATVCTNNTQDLPEMDNKAEEQEHFRRRNGVSDGECLNLDISQIGMFSLDDTIDMKSHSLVTSTPIVLGRGFERLRVSKSPDMHQKLSVINSIDAQSNDNLVGVSEHDTVNTPEPEPSSVNSDTCRQTRNGSTKCTLNSTTSQSVAVSKPPSKLAVRRKIPQPSCKSNIPKNQIPPRPHASKATSLAVKAKTVPTSQALNQTGTTLSTLYNLRRNVQLKGKNTGPAKNVLTVATVQTSPVTTSSSVCNSAVDLKPASTCVMQPKPSGLQPPGRGRFGLKPPGTVVFSAESSQSQANSKATGVRTRSSMLPGFAQKNASSEALPLAKRKKTDIPDHPVRAEARANSKLGGNVQRPVTAAKGVQPEKTNACRNSNESDCENCTRLQSKLHTFHQDLEGFLQGLEKMHTECENWMEFQQKFESCLEKFKSLQAEHQ